MASEHLGLARFASLGNKLSLDETDFVRAFAADPDTTVVALYLESVARGRALFDALRECPKPVLVQKANRTPLGQRIAFSHTAALAQDDAVLSAALAQAGAVRVATTRDMLAHLKACMLEGVRGRPAADVDALARIIWTVSHLVAEVPEIQELDLNPCLVHERGHGATIVDFRMALVRP